MAPAILLVDDQRDVLRLLHSALDTLGNPDLEILESASAEAALQTFGERQIELLVTDYNLPGINGADLLLRARAAQPGVRVIVITGNTDRKIRDEMLDAGALAVFNKPVPLGDFLDAAERGLGLARTILPKDADQQPGTNHLRVSDLLTNARRDLAADAVILISSRGLVVERAGGLRDSSMEVSLISALTATFSAGLKVAASNRQESANQISIFTEGDQDLILMAVDASYSLLIAGGGLADLETLAGRLRALGDLRTQVAEGLRQMNAPVPKKRTKTGELPKPAPEMDALLSGAPQRSMSQEDLDAYWDAAATQHGNKPMSKDSIPYDQARKMGLTPDSEG